MSVSLLKRAPWLGIVCFVTLLSVTLLEVSFYYPKVKAYFDNTGTLTAQNLAARSRQYLLESIELVTSPSYDADKKVQAEERLDIAYGLLNINYHVREYACAPESLQNLDSLIEQLQQQDSLNTNTYFQNILPVIRCTETIQTNTDSKRSELANEMLQELTFQLQLLVSGTCIVFIVGLIFWGVHLKQSKIINQKKNETHKWIQHAMEDSLTGAHNRRAFDIDLKQYSQNNKLHSLLMCDIDYFKQFNDRFGHPEGDKVLRIISTAIKTILRENDCLYRYGGEELIVILGNTNKADANKIAKRIISLIQNLDLPHPDSEHTVVTLSIGCASSNEENIHTENLVKLADERLYIAKRTGRNCLVSA